MADGSGPIIVSGAASLACGAPKLGKRVNWFAGAGGTSEAFKLAFGEGPDAAGNHCPVAISAHMRHNLGTQHFIGDVFALAPESILPGEHISFAWFSPDCTHHSRASGKAPKSARRRGLCWVVIDWMKARKPDVIMVENVWEFTDYGPLYPDDHPKAGQPNPELKGTEFRAWLRQASEAGYVCEYRKIVSALHGDPTTRERFYAIFRCDGLPIVWPEPTHANRIVAVEQCKLPFECAGDQIDWSIPCLSIFLTQEEADAEGLRVRRPLKPATMRRTAVGFKRHVAQAQSPYIVRMTHHGGARTRPVTDAAPTVTAANRGELALVDAEIAREAGYLVPRYGEREGQAPRCRSLQDAYPTAVATGNGGQLAAAHLVRHFGRSVGSDLADPVGSPTAGGGGKTGLGVAWLGRQFGSNVSGRDMHEPHPTAMPGGGKGGNKSQVVAAHLQSYYATGIGSDCAEPMRAATGKPRHALVAAWMEQANTGMVGRDLRQPISTIVLKGCTQRLVEARLEIEGGPIGRRGKVLAFLWEHFGTPTEAEWLDALATEQGRLRFGLVVIDGEVWRVVDIGLRMLVPAELLRCMGMDPSYDLEVDVDGRPISKTKQTHLIGNMTTRKTVAALIRANCPDALPLEMAA